MNFENGASGDVSVSDDFTKILKDMKSGDIYNSSLTIKNTNKKNAKYSIRLNLDGLEKWELLALRKDLKRIKKHNQQVLDRQLSNISKQLTKRKKANYND